MSKLEKIIKKHDPGITKDNSDILKSIKNMCIEYAVYYAQKHANNIAGNMFINNDGAEPFIDFFENLKLPSHED